MNVGPVRRVLLVVLVALATAYSSYASDTVPDWVRTAAQTPLPKLPESTKAVVLLDEQVYTVASNGKATTNERVVIKILRPQGRDYGIPAVPFDGDSKVTSMHVWSIDPAGHQFSLKDKDIVEVGEPGEEGQLFSDLRIKTAAPMGRDPGGIIAYEYTKQDRPYLAETVWQFQDELPRISQSFRLVLPAGYTYTTAWSHHASVDPNNLENQSFVWKLDDQPGIDLERTTMSPAPDSLFGRVSIHYTGPGMTVPQDGTWQGIGLWYEALSKDRLNASPDITAKALELTQGKTDFYDKAEAIGEFVQKQIRYFDIAIGIGGNQPHFAKDIFHNRYGDCKDHAALLSAMLSAVGIHSALVAVDTRRGIVDPNAPSIFGNHMIGAIEIPPGYESPKMRSVVVAKTGKRYLIFDPTWTYTPFGQLESNLQGGYGILMEGNKSQVIEFPVLDPKFNHVIRSAKLQLDPDGTLHGKVTENRFGDLAERTRAMIQLSDATKLTEFVDKKVAYDLNASSVKDFKSENVDALNKDLILNFDITAQRYATQAGPLLMVRPRVLGHLEMPVDHEPRTVDIDLDQTMSANDEIDIDLPSGYAVDELPPPVKLDLGFATYESTTVVSGHTLHYSRHYAMRQVTLPADKYADLQKLAGVIAEDEQSDAILRRTP
jgi:hypothetical protein